MVDAAIVMIETMNRHRKLGRGGGRRRAPVGGKVDERGVGLVAHRRDQRNLRGRGGAQGDGLPGGQLRGAAMTERHPNVAVLERFDPANPAGLPPPKPDTCSASTISR